LLTRKKNNSYKTHQLFAGLVRPSKQSVTEGDFRLISLFNKVIALFYKTFFTEIFDEMVEGRTMSGSSILGNFDKFYSTLSFNIRM
jgi:hypothetical protein